MWYGATECLVAVAYGRNDHNLYRLEANGHIEFLEEGDPANLFQPVRDLLNFLTVTFYKAFSSGKLRWARSMKLLLRPTMDCGGTSWMTSSRLLDSLQRGSRSFDTLNAKGTQGKFYLKLVFGLHLY